MLYYKRANIPYSQEELTERTARASAYIKVSCGISNNAAWACCLEALDKLRKHKNYKFKVKKGFQEAMLAFSKYESNLLYACKLFRVQDLYPEARKKYGNISDREYYDYWAAAGATAYTQRHDWVRNLQNKYKNSFARHGIKDEDTVAWGITAEAMLTLAECTYSNCIKIAAETHQIPEVLLHDVFGGLNIAHIRKIWTATMQQLEPKTRGYELDRLEQKNIQLALDDLSDRLIGLDAYTDAMKATAEEYDEVFRTKGEQKKAIREIADLKNQP